LRAASFAACSRSTFLLVKIALMPIANKSYHSMAKMRAVAPRLQALKEEYGDDRMRMSQEMMRIYKEEKVNPMAGCLPVLLQMPIFLALYWVLVESVQLRHAPWIGWIRDLSSMDPLFILPLIMGAAMFFQQMLNPQPQDPMQARVMKFMPIIFTVFMLFFPAGLVLYWTVNNLFSMAQQYFINKKVEREQAAKEAARNVV
jgi:YidC/Oxa1 family membrane protein insertase